VHGFIAPAMFVPDKTFGRTQTWLEIHRYLLTLLTKTSRHFLSESAVKGSLYALEATFEATLETSACTPKGRPDRSQEASGRSAFSSRLLSTGMAWSCLAMVD